MCLETFGLREAKMRHVNVFEINFLRPTVGITRWDTVRSYEIRRRAGIGELLAEKGDRIVLRWLGTLKGWMGDLGQEKSKLLL
mgnify:CR=1 FL=1